MWLAAIVAPVTYNVEIEKERLALAKFKLEAQIMQQEKDREAKIMQQKKNREAQTMQQENELARLRMEQDLEKEDLFIQAK